MIGIQRRIAAGLLALGTFASIGGTAAASDKVHEYNWRYESPLMQVDNPCTPELDNLTLDAQWHAVGKSWIKEDGSYWYQGTNRAHVSGTAVDGTRYTGAVGFRAQTRIIDGVASMVSDANHLLVSNGDAPNFTVRYKVYVTFAVDGSFSTVEVVKDGADCRG